MNIFRYRKKHKLSQAAFAALLTEHGYPATQSLVSQWETGGVTLTADWCRDIEVVTGGECTRLANRPDLFGELADSGLPVFPVRASAQHAPTGAN